MTQKGYIILGLVIFLCGCTKDQGLSEIQKDYEKASFYQSNGDFGQALKYYRLVSCEAKENDSIPYWWKSMVAEGLLFIYKNDLKAAKRNFELVLNFAERHSLNSVECLSWQRLGQIAWKEKKYMVADSCYKKAVDLSFHLKNGEKPLPDLEEESWMAASTVVLEKGLGNAAIFPDSLIRKLHVLAENGRMDLKVGALRLLAFYSEEKGMVDKGNRYLERYVRMNDSLANREFSVYSERMEQEKAQLILERDRETNVRQRILFISLAVLALILSGGVYAMVSYRRKYEMDHIRMLLLQKEKEITRLEQNRCELDQVRDLLNEKEHRLIELELRSHELDCVRNLLHDKEKQLSQLKEKFSEVNMMRDQIAVKQEELKRMELQFRATHFCESEIGSRVPFPDNPNKPKVEVFSGLFSKEKACNEFLEQMDLCFNNFASGLRKLSPRLTIEDLVYCCLFHLGVRPSNIAVMFCVSRNAVSMRRR